MCIANLSFLSVQIVYYLPVLIASKKWACFVQFLCRTSRYNPKGVTLKKAIRHMSCEEMSIKGHVVNYRTGQNLSELVISQLRFVDHIVDSSRIAVKLKETLRHLSNPCRESLIVCIPELVDEGDQNSLAPDLRTLMEENQKLTSSVLSALGKLHLDVDTVQEVGVTACISGRDVIPDTGPDR